MSTALYIPLQVPAEKPYKVAGNALTLMILKCGKLISNLSQLMRQVPNTLLYTK